MWKNGCLVKDKTNMIHLCLISNLCFLFHNNLFPWRSKCYIDLKTQFSLAWNSKTWCLMFIIVKNGITLCVVSCREKKYQQSTFATISFRSAWWTNTRNQKKISLIWNNNIPSWENSSKNIKNIVLELIFDIIIRRINSTLQ